MESMYHFPDISIVSINRGLPAGVYVCGDPITVTWKTYGTFGAQIDLSFTVLYRLPMTISVGVAQGIASGKQGKTEWMLSLKIL